MTDEELQPLLEQIVLDRLSIPTLERRGRDFFDYHEISVWGLLTVLTDAYQAGVAEGRRINSVTRRPASARTEIGSS